MEDTARIKACVSNRLDEQAIGRKRIAGIIGDAPSHYAKSPSLWNATFRALGMEAVYLPFDVEESRLPEFMAALKDSERFMGGNVTVPYKLEVMRYLDELDEKAEQIGAVNTIVRTAGGRLIGYNTDGQGFLDSILSPRPGEARPFIESPEGMAALIIGAGGAARAVAFYLAGASAGGKLLICNRTHERARALAAELNKAFGNAEAIPAEALEDAAPQVGLLVNCSTTGQGGIRRSPDGGMTCLEPYSALASASPATIERQDTEPEFYRQWLSASLGDIERNNRASLRVALAVPASTGFCDLVYFPFETVFLRHGRLSGHPTLNGKGMNVAQAADAFFHKVCSAYLQQLGMNGPDGYGRVLETMYRAW